MTTTFFIRCLAASTLLILSACDLQTLRLKPQTYSQQPIEVSLPKYQTIRLSTKNRNHRNASVDVMRYRQACELYQADPLVQRLVDNAFLVEPMHCVWTDTDDSSPQLVLEHEWQRRWTGQMDYIIRLYDNTTGMIYSEYPVAAVPVADYPSSVANDLVMLTWRKAKLIAQKEGRANLFHERMMHQCDSSGFGESCQRHFSAGTF